jgi:hypothetical protein
VIRNVRKNRETHKAGFFTLLLTKRIRKLPRSGIGVEYITAHKFWQSGRLPRAEGQRDLLKHLVIANFLFDYLLIAIANIGLGMAVEKAIFPVTPAPKPI